jgi:Uma2 family endonuclease
VRANELGRVFGAETGFRIARDPDTVRAPDLAFVSHSRLPAGRSPDGYLDLAPDLVVEIVSPSDRAQDVQEKMQDWMQAGSRLGWLFYPARQPVAVYRSATEVHLLGPDDELDGGDVLPGFRCPVRDFFPG